MSSEAITQNDLREILSRTVGSIPSEYKKLLWTNPSLSSGRSAFDLTFDNAYDAYEIIFSMDNGGYLFLPSVLAVAGNSPCGADFTHTSGGRYYRSVTLNGATLSFTTGYYNGSANVNACVPYKIYGIKYERVAPPQVDASDYVIDQGTDGIWTYRKWNSGIAECWASKSFTSGSWNAWGGGFDSANQWSFGTYPTGLFITTPVIQVSCGGFSASLVEYGSYGTNTTAPSGWLFRGASGSSMTGVVGCQAIGKWK